MRYRRNRVLITGTSRGIGLELARVFLEKGHTVIGTSRQPDLLSPEALPHPDRYRVCRLDLTDSRSIRSLPEITGPVDILIHNAGISQAGASEDADMERINTLFRLNLFGIIELNRCFLPLMRQAGRGDIIVMNSLASAIPVPYSGFYAASKAAAAAYIRAARMEMKQYGIGLCSVFFDYVQTSLPQISSSPESSAHAEMIRHVRSIRNAMIAGGHAPAYIAAKVYDLCQRRQLPPGKIIGLRAKRVYLLQKALPERVIEHLVIKRFLP